MLKMTTSVDSDSNIPFQRWFGFNYEKCVGQFAHVLFSGRSCKINWKITSTVHSDV
uniref:Uncharacterized protein n=1 Tax=Arundo donax TaxID=35708 RepID=A0A0A9EB24_ARUDO